MSGMHLLQRMVFSVIHWSLSLIHQELYMSACENFDNHDCTITHYFLSMRMKQSDWLIQLSQRAVTKFIKYRTRFSKREQNVYLNSLINKI